MDAPAEPTAVTRDPDPPALPADAEPSALAPDPPAALPVDPLQDAPAVADPLTGAAPEQVVVVVEVVVIGGEAGDGVGVTDVAGGGVAGGDAAGGDVAVGMVVVAVVVVVVVDPAGGVVVVGAGVVVVVIVVVVVVVVVDDVSATAGAGVDVDAPVAAAPADCSPLVAQAAEHGRTSRTQRATEAPSTAIDDLRLMPASPVPERDVCRLHPAV